MSCTIHLLNGNYITVDDVDKDWIELERWRWVVKISNTGAENVYIESENKRQRYLHNLFFKKGSNHRRIEFVNGDPFDYRRSNIYRTSYAFRRRYRAKNEKTVRVIKRGAVGIMATKCTIAPTNLCYRSFLCSTCSTVDIGCYERCLEIAAGGNWRGWEVVEKGPWCLRLQQKIWEEENSISH